MTKIYPSRQILLSFFLLFIFSQKINAQLVSQPYEILLKAERINVIENIETIDLKNEISSSEIVEGKYFRLIQFYEIPNADLQKEIRAVGIELLDYIPNKAYIASIPKGMLENDLQKLNIRSVLKINETWKQSEDVRFRNFGDWAVNRDHVDLSLRYYQSLNQTKVIAQLENLGARIIKSPDFIHIIQVRIPINQVQDIVELPSISYVSQITDPGRPEDDLARALHRTNMIDSDFPSGRHYDGTGVTILVRDDGDVGPHIDFHGRLFQNNTDFTGTHGDGVAGVAGGAGNLNPRYRGAATGADVYVRQYFADFLDETLDLHLNNGVDITNSSYSNGCNAGYTDITETVDLQIHQNPTFMHVFSAGNSNNQECGYGAGNQWGNITGGHKQGKNVIATANLNADATIVNSSSRGPAHDGRIKPDISSNGRNQISTDPNNTYEPFGGTSAAAPGVMGTMAQLYQAYKELNGGANPESGLIKAALLNTANDLGNAGPDFIFGWGHLNAFNGVRLLEDERYLSANIDQGGSNDHTINIPAGTNQVRFMLYWMDKEGTPFSAKALVNDMNLTVNDPTGTTLMPWVLDITPDPTSLNLPAGNGIDNLNNVEQVLIDNPIAGDYTISVEGFEIPFGATKYYVLYEVIQDDVTMIYPNGGEGFVTGEIERIHWDAWGNTENFTLEYTLDNGANWNMIATVLNNARMYDWNVPTTMNGNAKIRVTRGASSSESEANFSIGAIPQNVHVIEACADAITIEWNEVIGATSYDVYSLGSKYMDIVGNTTDLTFEVPISDPFGENWFAVRARGIDNYVGRRTIAINHSAGYFNCVVDNDIASQTLLSPSAGLLTACDDYVQDVSMVIRNNGTSPLTNFNLYYQVNNQTPVMETYSGMIGSQEEETYTFGTPITLSASGEYDVTAWVDLPIDPASFNDTLMTSFSLNFVANPTAPDIVEDMESGTFPPAQWSIVNPDESDTWMQSNVITGSDGNPTVAAMMLNYFYNTDFLEDELVSFPIDLTSAASPLLSFDIAYATYSATLADSFRVDVYLDCGSQFHSTLYGAFNLDLATVGAVGNSWSPENASDWRNEVIDLSALVGEEIVLKFVNINNYGNNLYLDNINVFNANAAPVAGISTTANEICVGEEIVVENVSSGFGNMYDWNFGVNPNVTPIAGTNSFIVSYTTSGLKTITLSAANGNGTDMTSIDIMVEDPPVPSFTYTIENGVVTFTNTSTNSGGYIWDFGDGNAASSENPVHEYSVSNIYTITLVAQSDVCGDESYTEQVEVIITSIDDNEIDFDAIVLPNPNNGNFNVKISDFTSRDFDLELVDVTGKQIRNWSVQSTQGDTFIPVDKNALTAGIYFVKIKNENSVKTLKVIVQ